jgi:hypothetical protein
MRTILAALGAAMVLVCLPSGARAEDGPPRIDPDKSIKCLTDGDGRLWRVQCTPEDDASARARVCVYAPDSELDEDGQWVRPLERATRCYPDGEFDQDALKAKGYTLLPGLADAPAGWMRDRRGRVFQVNFDLHRRLYAGVRWAPRFGDDGGLGRVALDFGLFEWEHTTNGGRPGALRHRVRLVEGDVELAPFAADLTVLHYDLSWRAQRPLVRLTTFFGTPRRHDLGTPIGAWLEAGRLHIDEVAPDQRDTLWRFVTLHMTLELWRNQDMSSFVRLRGGVGFEEAHLEDQAERVAFTPAGALEGDLTLDRDGFHHVTFAAEAERPGYVETIEGRGHARRAEVRAAYELILVAVNDQPVTLRIGGEAAYRDDIPGVAAGWDLRASAGLRLSLWAPPRP